MTIKYDHTSRGFTYGTFSDSYGMVCSIQKSSAATDDYIWLGPDDLKPIIMKSDAIKLGLEVSHPVEGWMDYPIPDQVHILPRMHLNRQQAKMLADQLLYFVENGDLPE